MQSNRKKYQYLVLPLNPANQQKDWKKIMEKEGPSTSGINRKGGPIPLLSEDEWPETSDGDSIAEEEKCCFCHDWQTKELQNSTCVVLWSGANVTSVTIGLTFSIVLLFECWGGETLLSVPIVKIIEKKMNKNSVMFITFSSCSVFFYLLLSF